MPALTAPTVAASVSSGTTAIHHHHHNHFDNHFDGPLLGDQRQMEEFARLLEPYLRRRLG